VPRGMVASALRSMCGPLMMLRCEPVRGEGRCPWEVRGGGACMTGSCAQMCSTKRLLFWRSVSHGWLTCQAAFFAAMEAGVCVSAGCQKKIGRFWGRTERDLWLRVPRIDDFE